MTTRILPREEWPALVGTELEAVWPHLPADAQVIVIEDQGAIVGCWALFHQLHAEGVWVHPAHRGKTTVARRLLMGLRATARRLGVRSVATAATTDDVRRMLATLGVQLPGDHYVIPV